MLLQFSFSCFGIFGAKFLPPYPCFLLFSRSLVLPSCWLKGSNLCSVSLVTHTVCCFASRDCFLYLAGHTWTLPKFLGSSVPLPSWHHCCGINDCRLLPPLSRSTCHMAMTTPPCHHRFCAVAYILHGVFGGVRARA